MKQTVAARRSPEEIEAMLDDIFTCPPELADLPAWVLLADRDGLVEMTLDEAKEWL